MFVFKFILLFGVFTCFNCEDIINLKGLKSFDELYTDGINAYWDGNWDDCIYYLEESLHSYRTMKNLFKNCSKLCQDTTLYSSNTDSFEFIINKAVCLENCEKKLVGKSGLFSRISVDMLDNFKNKKPYVYLQFAYYRVGKYAESVEAAYTYSQYDPNDPLMKGNMEFFSNHENTTQDMFINRELPLHILEYNLGLESFNGKDFKEAITHFDAAVKEFYDSESGCRAMCEGEYDGGKEYLNTYTSFHIQTVDHYRHLLECYLTCPNETARMSRDHHVVNFLPRLYVYLHYSYHLYNDLINAVRSLKSFLLFFPDDHVANSRLKFYENTNLSSYEESSHFHRMHHLHSMLLGYIYQNFGMHDKHVPNIYSQTADDIFSHSLMKELNNMNKDAESLSSPTTSEKTNTNEDDVDISHLRDTHIGYSTVDSKYLIDISDSSSVGSPPIPEGPVLSDSFKLLANSSQMAGPLRFALDNFTTAEDCKKLIDLELTGGLLGDGYRGRPSPHTEHELFQGISVHRAVELAEKGKLPLSAARLYYDLSERVRQQVAAYFKLDQLYFDYTHLVCRTALKGSPKSRSDNSHPVHADNCNLQDNGDCLQESPAFTWRDYSAIMYLNSDFEGGQFVMTDHTGRRVMLQVRPKCGRLVSFSAGKDCLHGVKPVVRGRRCAVALWFTLDPKHDEKSRKEAKIVLDRLQRDEL